MPPKKIKLLEKTLKLGKQITVDSDDVDIQAEESINKKEKTIINKKLIKKIPEPIIKDEDDAADVANSEDIEVVEGDKDVANAEDIEGVKVNKPKKNVNKPSDTKKSLKDESHGSEAEIKIKQLNPKPKKNTLIKQSDSAFDMFGDDKDDYREILINYDYTKNKTLPKITKYEKALLIGKRAKQIEDGANPNIKVMAGQSAIDIAEEELRQRKIPLIIKRPNGNTFEYWKPADMEVLME